MHLHPCSCISDFGSVAVCLGFLPVLVHMLSGRRALLFMVYAALNCNVLIHFPVLQILLRTCLEERNQVVMKVHLINKGLKGTQGISQQLLGLCLC